MRSCPVAEVVLALRPATVVQTPPYHDPCSRLECCARQINKGISTSQALRFTLRKFWTESCLSIRLSSASRRPVNLIPKDLPKDEGTVGMVHRKPIFPYTFSDVPDVKVAKWPETKPHKNNYSTKYISCGRHQLSTKQALQAPRNCLKSLRLRGCS